MISHIKKSEVQRFSQENLQAVQQQCLFMAVNRHLYFRSVLVNVSEHRDFT